MITYTWEDTGKLSGPVTDFDRAPTLGEKSGEISIDFLSKGLNPKFYTVLRGEIKVKDSLATPMTKEDAFNVVEAAINDRNRLENLKSFPYSKEGETSTYNYVADIESIQGVQNDCVAKVILNPESITEPIPVPKGVWKTDDITGEGDPIYVPFSLGEFIVFASKYMERSANNFGVKEVHKAQLRSLLGNDLITYEDLMAYDLSNGWF